MTDTYAIEEAWQDEPAVYERLRAVRQMTDGCPCDGCRWWDECRQSGRECSRFKAWCKSGKS